MLSEEALKELTTILKAEYGLNLSPKEVFAVAQGLVGFFDKLVRLDQIKKQNGRRVANKTI